MSGRHNQNGFKERTSTKIKNITDNVGLPDKHFSLATSLHVSFKLRFRNHRQKKTSTNTVKKVTQQFENALERQHDRIGRITSYAEINDSTIKTLKRQLVILHQQYRRALEQADIENSYLTLRLAQYRVDKDAPQKALKPLQDVQSERDSLKESFKVQDLRIQLEKYKRQMKHLRNNNALLKIKMKKIETTNTRLRLLVRRNFNKTTFDVANNKLVKQDKKLKSKHQFCIMQDKPIEFNVDFQERERGNRDETDNMETNATFEIVENQPCNSMIPDEDATRRIGKRKQKKRRKKSLKTIRQKTTNVSEQRCKMTSDEKTAFNIEKDDSDSDAHNKKRSIYHNVTCVLKTKQTEKLLLFLFLVLSFLTSYICYYLTSNIK